MIDDRSQGTEAEQKAWCTEGPQRYDNGKPEAFVTYALGGCWQPDTVTSENPDGVQTIATNGWTTPCPCYYGDKGKTEFGYYQLGDREKECKANHVYTQR